MVTSVKGCCCIVKNSITEGLHVTISGRVQGVGFRYATHDAAFRLGLAGWVRNLPDGRVEAFFEGPRQDLESMLAWCNHGPRMADVTDVAHQWQRGAPRCDGFRITG